MQNIAKYGKARQGKVCYLNKKYFFNVKFLVTLRYFQVSLSFLLLCFGPFHFHLSLVAFDKLSQYQQIGFFLLLFPIKTKQHTKPFHLFYSFFVVSVFKNSNSNKNHQSKSIWSIHQANNGIFKPNNAKKGTKLNNDPINYCSQFIQVKKCHQEKIIKKIFPNFVRANKIFKIKHWTGK